MAVLAATLANLLTLLRLLLGLAFPWIPHGWRVAVAVLGRSPTLPMVRDAVVGVGGMWFVWTRQPSLSRLRVRPADKIATAGQLMFLVSLLLLPEMDLRLFWATAILTAVAAVDYAAAFFRGARSSNRKNCFGAP